MSEPTSTAQFPTPNGRTDDGRFAPGNKCGTGNPFAREVAALRAALVRAVKPDDIEAITAKLVDDARNGDKAAAKLLLQYAIGKPQPAPDPDTLDAHELRVRLTETATEEVVEQMNAGMPLSVLLDMWTVTQHYRELNMRDEVLRQLRGGDRDDRRAERNRRRRARRKARRRAEREQAAAPSANGSDGRVSPSAHGGNGHGTLNDLLGRLGARPEV